MLISTTLKGVRLGLKIKALKAHEIVTTYPVGTKCFFSLEQIPAVHNAISHIDFSILILSYSHHFAEDLILK